MRVFNRGRRPAHHIGRQADFWKEIGMPWTSLPEYFKTNPVEFDALQLVPRSHLRCVNRSRDRFGQAGKPETPPPHPTDRPPTKHWSIRHSKARWENIKFQFFRLLSKWFVSPPISRWTFGACLERLPPCISFTFSSFNPAKANKHIPWIFGRK